MNIKLNEINSFKRELCVSVSWKKFHPNFLYKGVLADPLILSKGIPFVKLKGFSNFHEVLFNFLSFSSLISSSISSLYSSSINIYSF